MSQVQVESKSVAEPDQINNHNDVDAQVPIAVVTPSNQEGTENIGDDVVGQTNNHGSSTHDDEARVNKAQDEIVDTNVDGSDGATSSHQKEDPSPQNVTTSDVSSNDQGNNNNHVDQTVSRDNHTHNNVSSVNPNEEPVEIVELVKQQSDNKQHQQNDNNQQPQQDDNNQQQAGDVQQQAQNESQQQNHVQDGQNSIYQNNDETNKNDGHTHPERQNAPDGSQSHPAPPRGLGLRGPPMPGSMHSQYGSNENHVPQIPKHIGEWYCPSCNILNYSKRVDCIKCRTPKPAYLPPPIVADRMRDRNYGGNNTFNQPQAVAIPPPPTEITTTEAYVVDPINPQNCRYQAILHDALVNLAGFGLPGDWICASCWNHNFNLRQECKHCHSIKPPNGNELFDQAFALFGWLRRPGIINNRLLKGNNAMRPRHNNYNNTGYNPNQNWNNNNNFRYNNNQNWNTNQSQNQNQQWNNPNNQTQQWNNTQQQTGGWNMNQQQPQQQQQQQQGVWDQTNQNWNNNQQQSGWNNNQQWDQTNQNWNNNQQQSMPQGGWDQTNQNWNNQQQSSWNNNNNNNNNFQQGGWDQTAQQTGAWNTNTNTNQPQGGWDQTTTNQVQNWNNVPQQQPQGNW